MLVTLAIGSITIIVTMGIQVFAVVYMLRYLFRKIAHVDAQNNELGFGFDFYVIIVVLAMLFLGHMIQIAIWALLFMQLDEFSNFLTAFYHSTVNFSSLGYGDIVMSEKWRLLGALEASNGILMFGLSTGTLLSIMGNLFSRHAEFESFPSRKLKDNIKPS
jgi:hypothetical protein